MKEYYSNEFFYNETKEQLANFTSCDEFKILEAIENINGVNQVLIHDYSYNNDCILKCNVDSLNEYVFIELSKNWNDEYYITNLLKIL